MSAFESGWAGFIEANLASVWPGSRAVYHLAGQPARQRTRLGAANRREISDFSKELAFGERRGPKSSELR